MLSADAPAAMSVLFFARCFRHVARETSGVAGETVSSLARASHIGKSFRRGDRPTAAAASCASPLRVVGSFGH